jgi:hypothetical protein
MYRRAFRNTASTRFWTLPSVALLVLGCGKAAFDGRTYQAGDLAFRIGQVPSTWRELEVDEARLAYRDPATDTIISVNARCGRDADDVPLDALTQHLFIQFTERNIIDQKRFDLDGREALRTVLNAKLDGVPRRFRVVVLKKDGCVYDFSEIATLRATAQSDSVFESVVSGFSTKGR